jgi:hypothetical protein
MSRFLYAACLMLAASLLISPFPPVQGSSQAAPALDVVLTEQNPYPVEPGKNVNIDVQVRNNGLANSPDTVVEIVVKEPFTLLPGEEQVKVFGNIPADDYVKTSYKLHVNSQAITDDYEIEFRMHPRGSTDYTVGKINIRVEGAPELVLGGIEADSEKIEPGSKIRLSVPIKNIGTGTARKLQAELLSNYTEIVPIFSEGFVYLGDIEPGQAKIATFRIGVDGAAEHKTYTLGLRASYKDEDNEAASQTFSIGLPVEGSIILEIIKIEPKYERGLMGVEVANKGTANAKALEARLVVGNKTIGIDYVSQLKESKKTTFDFPLILKGRGQLMIEYIGPGTEKNVIAKDVVFDFTPPQSGDGTADLILVIAAAVIIYLVYRKFFRKKKG